MNHKGQVLAIFVLLLPILLISASLIIDVGLSYIEKRNIERATEETIYYALDHLDQDATALKTNMTYLLNENIKNIYDLRLTIENEIITISIEKRTNYIFTKNKGIIKLQYQGKIIDGKKIITKE